MRIEKHPRKKEFALILDTWEDEHKDLSRICFLCINNKTVSKEIRQLACDIVNAIKETNIFSLKD